MKASGDDNSESASVNSSRHADNLEIGEAMQKLTLSELRRLEEHARNHTRFGVLFGQHEDLLNEAILLTLTEKRYWYIDKNPTIFEHLRWLIKTIAFEKRKKLLILDERSQKKLPKLLALDSEENKDLQKHLADFSPNVENKYEQEETVRRIYKYFFEDQAITDVLDYIILGYDRNETIRELGITTTEYETIRKRIKRKESKLRKILSMNEK